MTGPAAPEASVPHQDVPAVVSPPEKSRAAPASRVADAALQAGLIAGAIAAALGLSATLLGVTGWPPGEAFSAMVKGSIGSVPSLVTSLNHAAPILAVAIGAAVAGRAGLVNIGQEGQMIIGATAAVVIGINVSGPSVFAVPVVLLAGAAGGAVWAGIAAVLRYRSSVNEVITTLLLNFIAFALVSYLVNRAGLLQESKPSDSVTAATPQTDPLPAVARLPYLATGRGFALHWGILVALLLAVLAGFVITRTVWGFRLRMFGMNPRVARRAGVRAVIFGTGALMLSGAFAGLGGSILLAGTSYRVNPGFSNNYGWEGLLVGLVARFDPVVAVPVALLFGALRAGGGVLASTGVSPAIVGVIQALIVLAISLPQLYMRRRRAQVQAAVNARSAEIQATLACKEVETAHAR